MPDIWGTQFATHADDGYGPQSSWQKRNVHAGWGAVVSEITRRSCFHKTAVLVFLGGLSILRWAHRKDLATPLPLSASLPGRSIHEPYLDRSGRYLPLAR